MSVRMRHTRAHTKNRRSHHALKEPRLSKCTNCGQPHRRHHTCENCGMYRGKQVIDVASQKERFEKRRKEKMRSLGKEVPGEKQKEKDKDEEASIESHDENKPLSPEDLSRKSI